MMEIVLVIAVVAVAFLMGFLAYRRFGKKDKKEDLSVVPYDGGDNQEPDKQTTFTSPTPGPQKDEAEDDSHHGIRTTVLVVMAGIHLSLITISVIFTKPDGIMWWALAITFALGHFGSSVKIILEQEMGVLIFLGRILSELRSGPVFAPWPYRIRRVTRNAIQVEFGTLDEKNVERSSRSESSDTWFIMKEPIRINWGDMRSYKGIKPLTSEERMSFENDPYAQRLTTDPHLFFRIRVFNFKQLIQRVGGVEEAMEWIKDTCVSALQEEAGKTFVALAVTQTEELSAKIKKRVENLVRDPDADARGEGEGKSWGIDVEEVRIKDLGTPHRTNTSVADRAAEIAKADGEAIAAARRAEGEKKKRQTEAEGKAYATVQQAEADMQKAINEGEGRASAIAAITNASDSDTGRLILKIEALKEGLQYGKTVVMPLDQSILTGAVSIKEVLDAVGGKSPNTPPSTDTSSPTK